MNFKIQPGFMCNDTMDTCTKSLWFICYSLKKKYIKHINNVQRLAESSAQLFKLGQTQKNLTASKDYSTDQLIPRRGIVHHSSARPLSMMMSYD